MNRTYPVTSRKPSLWVEVLITVFGIAGVILFFALYETAFPDASMDVTISRSQAKEIAQQQLSDMGYSVDGYDFALSFSSDSSAAYYLQRTLGIQQYNARLESEQWPIYFWSARWFKPEEKEEYRVYLMPDGSFLGLSHIIKEDAPGTEVSQAEAQTIAESFLTQYANWKPADWEQIQASSQTLPGGRVDHTFAWKSKSYSAGESELLYTTIVQGNRVGFADSYIKVPEAFIRQYAAERNIAGFINNIAYFLAVFGFLLIGLVAIALSRPDLRRPVIPVLLVAGVTLASFLNSIPLYKFYYGTTENYLLFWIQGIVGAFFGTVFYAIQVLLLLLGAYSLMRFAWPRQDRILARGPDRQMNFSRSAWRGLMVGGIMMGYGVLFYTITTNYLGWWSPVTNEYSDMFATPFPFVYAVEAGLNAALIEELSIRLIGIGFFLWLFRGKLKWLAVLIPSLIWAFAHTSYVSYPIYARGVELTIVALFLGFIFLKFNLLTTIMAHFTYNMMLTGIVLLRSSDRYYQISGWIVVLILFLPLLPGIYLLIRRRVQQEAPVPKDLILSAFQPADLEQLSTLPIIADWQTLIAQPNRILLCLRTDTKIAGFATGFLGGNNIGYIDGVYVKQDWRRQYWGTILLDALQDELKNCGATEVRAGVKPEENLSRAFLHNVFWRTGVYILTPGEARPTFMNALKSLFSEMRKEKLGPSELEIPRNLM